LIAAPCHDTPKRLARSRVGYVKPGTTVRQNLTSQPLRNVQLRLTGKVDGALSTYLSQQQISVAAVRAESR
jgi:hypothetical protein